jgi:hypothetical protein
MRLRTIIIALVALAVVGTGTAVAASSYNTLHNTKNYTLKPGKTWTWNVPYLNPGEYAKNAYTGTIKISMPSSGTKPNLKLVHIKKKGTTHSGNDFSATIQNSNKKGTAPVKIKITANTKTPGFY